MRRTLSYARPQDRLDYAEHHHGRELCSAPLLELVVMTLAENQEGSARTELPLCSIFSCLSAAEFAPETAPVDALVSSDAFAVVFVASPYLTQDDTLVSMNNAYSVLVY